MKCIVCHSGETSPEAVAVNLSRDDRRLVLPHVPADVCASCGESYVDEAVAQWILVVAAGTTK